MAPHIRAELIAARNDAMRVARDVRRDARPEDAGIVSALVASARESQRYALMYMKAGRP